MSAKKKKQSNSPLRVIIILVLLGLLAYKHQLFDGKLLENIPTIESNEEKRNQRITAEIVMRIYRKIRPTAYNSYQYRQERCMQ